MSASSTCQQFGGNLFADDVLANSAPTYRMLRDLGDVVWVPELGLYVVARFDDVVLGLRAADTLISSLGVSVNESANGVEGSTGTSTLTSDGDRHQALKRLEMRPLLPGKLNVLAERIFALADAKVAELVGAGQVDAIAQLAAYLPTVVVAELVGIKHLGPERMLEWSNAVFDAFGPATNQRTGAAFPTIAQFVEFGAELTREDIVPGSWADRIFDAIERGDIALKDGRELIFDYVIPSLDTTIYATGEMLFQLASAPQAFDELRQNPALYGSAILESVRLASPLRGFTRFAAADFRFSETTVPKGSRVWLLNASANLDERHYAEPDRFDIHRNPRDHLGWGHGVHMCVGMHLARLEMEAVLRALVNHVGRMELGTPVRLINNAAQGYAQLPVTFHPR
jgi:cytochrome P450